MPLLPGRPTTIAAVLVAGLALGACDALDGDLAPSAVTGVGATGDVAATAYDGEVVITADELADAHEELLGVDELEMMQAPDPRGYLATQLQLLELLLQDAVYRRAAEEQFDITVTEADVEEQIASLADEVGGMDELETFLQEQGSSVAQQRATLPLRLLAPQVIERLEQEQDGDPSELLRAWSREQMAEADPEVARRFGAWDPARTALVPADAYSAGAQAAP